MCVCVCVCVCGLALLGFSTEFLFLVSVLVLPYIFFSSLFDYDDEISISFPTEFRLAFRRVLRYLFYGFF